MSYRIRYTRQAKEDLERLYRFMLELDLGAALRAKRTILNSMAVLREFPFVCRKAQPDNPFLRELVISFGSTGYVALFEIEDSSTVTVLALRHQREDDFR